MTAFPRTYHVTVPLIRFFKWEYGTSISLHTGPDYMWNVGICLLTLRRQI